MGRDKKKWSQQWFTLLNPQTLFQDNVDLEFAFKMDQWRPKSNTRSYTPNPSCYAEPGAPCIIWSQWLHPELDLGVEGHKNPTNFFLSTRCLSWEQMAWSQEAVVEVEGEVEAGGRGGCSGGGSMVDPRPAMAATNSQCSNKTKSHFSSQIQNTYHILWHFQTPTSFSHVYICWFCVW